MYLLALLSLLDTRLLSLFVIDWLTDWLTDWQSDWLTDRLTDWLIDWLIDCLIDWLTDLQTDWLLTDWLTDSLTDWLIDLIDCVARSLMFNHYKGIPWKLKLIMTILKYCRRENFTKDFPEKLWSWAWFSNIFIEIFNYRGFSLKNEVEHDFFEGLSTSVISKFARPPPNLTRIGNPYDFANAS